MFDTSIFAAQKLAETEALRRDEELRRNALRRIARPPGPSLFARVAARLTRGPAPEPVRPYSPAWTDDNPVWT